uniref:MLO-like protein n=1 Tax=Daucus carota subsp. sativus TaxID=79200 RepID=A0A164XSQ4_DAUCS
MSGGDAPGARQLDQTPTWAVGLVCAVIVIFSILLEKILHYIGHYFEKRHKTALVEALEKIKSELMILGFISLLLTFTQSYIARICIPEHIANTMLPCARHSESTHQPTQEGNHQEGGGHRRLLWNEHRMLSGGGGHQRKCHDGQQPLISVDGVHQLHIFIFFLALFHVIYSALTMILGRAKIRRWKNWEREADAMDPNSEQAKFRLTHETSFVKAHTSFWTKTPVLFYLVCFFRQFFRSVGKSDYLTMRHGFISVHLSPGTKFDFQKYIKRSLEDDFKVIVGISPVLWTSAVIYLTLNVEGWQAMFWLSVLPLVMGSTMKKSIFDEQTNKALMSWAKHAAKKKVDGKPGPIATHNPHSPSGSPQDSPSHPHSRKVHFDCAYRGITAISSRESKLLAGNRSIAQPYEFKVGATPGKERKRDFVDNPNGLFSAQASPKPPPAMYSVVEGMKVGGKRTVIVPPEAGYGKRGMNEIPPGATFDLNIELLQIMQPEGK